MWEDFLSDNYPKPTVFTDTAQICLNGDVINDSTNRSPQLNKKFCPKCGEPTITKCPECGKEIAGEIHYSNVFGAHSFKRPAFCIECGKPYPWTIRKLKSVKELASEIDELTPEEHKTLDKSIDEITKDDTQAQVGAMRIKKIMSRIGNAASEILQKTIVDVASETAKKVILGR
ncbi:DUF2321 domain-containing protein [Patescibacteria group bacterium]|nr:DUF2321 domain-containing protein [Patescibacteria group bacterium]